MIKTSQLIGYLIIVIIVREVNTMEIVKNSNKKMAKVAPDRTGL